MTLCDADCLAGRSTGAAPSQKSERSGDGFWLSEGGDPVCIPRSCQRYIPRLGCATLGRSTNHGERTDNTAKHLGVNINSKLSWNHHVDAITKKANSTLSFLRCNTSNCPRPVKSYCYETYVRPTLEYASTVCDPTTKHNINKLGMLQRRAARYVHSDWRRHSSPTEMKQ